MTERYQPTGKRLTEYEHELLVILMEECAGVTQAASKLLRFGKENRPEPGGEPNTVVLAHEIGDLQELIEMVGATRIISVVDVTAGRKRKRERLAYYMQARA